MKFKTLIAPIIALVTSTGTTHGIMTPYQELEERNTLIASIDEDTPLYFDQAGAAKDSKCSQYGHSSHSSHSSRSSHSSHSSHRSGW